MAKLIAVAGFARSGKDTFVTILMEKLAQQGITSERYAFASPIKKYVNELFGWDERHANGELKEVKDEFWGFSPRHAYQTFGTEWGRKSLRDDIWLLKAQKTVEESANDFVIVPDLRFPNEMEWVRARGGAVVGIKSRGRREKIGETETEMLHESESYVKEIVDNSNWVVNNDKTLGLSFLEAQVELFIKTL